MVWPVIDWRRSTGATIELPNGKHPHECVVDVLPEFVFRDAAVDLAIVVGKRPKIRLRTIALRSFKMHHVMAARAQKRDPLQLDHLRVEERVHLVSMDQAGLSLDGFAYFTTEIATLKVLLSQARRDA